MSYFKAKYTKFDFSWGSTPTPAEELQRSPDSLTGFEGVLLLRKEKGMKEREGKGNGRKRERKEK